jgi:hypothetical protein
MRQCQGLLSREKHWNRVEAWKYFHSNASGFLADKFIGKAPPPRNSGNSARLMTPDRVLAYRTGK